MSGVDFNASNTLGSIICELGCAPNGWKQDCGTTKGTTKGSDCGTTKGSEQDSCEQDCRATDGLEQGGNRFSGL